MNTETLVVELLTEELPPKALKRLGEAFAHSLTQGLKDQGLLEQESVTTAFATPRRLAVSITHVRSVGRDQPIDRKLLPRAQVDGSGGAASPILKKRLAKEGREHLAALYPEGRADDDRLYIKHDGKTDFVMLGMLAKGALLESGLESALGAAITSLPVPKMMTYQRGEDVLELTASRSYHFVRPAHRLLALHGTDVVAVEAECLGLVAGRTTRGHRFASRGDIEIATAEAYEPTLAAEGKVIASFATRRERIVEALMQVAARHESGSAKPIMPEALVDEVTALVEWPAVYAGSFDPAFLDVPQECLVLTMQQNQKYFALAGSDGRLLSTFLVVSNLETPHPDAIIRGNERVLRARLADAKFFFDQDRKLTLASRLPRLDAIVYHNKLYSQRVRVQKLQRIAVEIANELGADAVATARAANLCKADLVTDMVGEFPELQGLMGRYYAAHDGETSVVADAIEQHYWPRFSGDALPRSPVAQSVALADKLLAIAEMFGIGNAPTGDKDPYGLRRAALGVLRILIEGRLPLELDGLVAKAFATLSDVANVQPRSAEVIGFFIERLRAYLRDQGYTANEAEAVLSLRPSRIDLIPAQMEAIRIFAALPEASALAAANKRIGNILRKSGDEGSRSIDRALLAAGAEHDLHTAVESLLPIVRTHVDTGNYTQALQALAGARGAVDRFFDDVMVMVDDPALRANRLALLRRLAEAMNQVADISKLAA